MGNIKVGDEVLTPYGDVAKVEGIYPQGYVDVFRVGFGDGCDTETSADHLWEIEERRIDSTWKVRRRLVTTADLGAMATVTQRRRGTTRRPSVAVPVSVAFGQQYVPLDPYLLGLLIGDGHLRGEGIRITSADEEILEYIRTAIAPLGMSLKRVGSTYDYRLRCDVNRKYNPIIRALKNLGLWDHLSQEKFIPSIYKYNTESVRLEVLRGILDTDGSVDDNGQARLEQTSRHLAEDVAEVVQSLGGMCTMRTKMGAYRMPNGERKQTQLVYRQAVIYHDARRLFRLRRKQGSARQRANEIRRLIHSVTASGKAECQCIKISDPRGLYLTDNFIATHNTTGIAKRCVKRFLLGRRQLYATPTSDQLGRFWKEVCRALRNPIAAGIFVKNETNKTIEEPGTERRIKAKTAWNADSLRGDYADDLYLDEWQLMNEDAWEVVGAPMLLDNNGDAVFIYTPPSMNSRSVTKAKDPRHAPKMFKKALADIEAAKKEGRESRWAAFHFTSHDNPYISAVALDELTQDMTSLAIKQEIEAEDTEEVPGALWKLATIDKYRIGAPGMPARLPEDLTAIDVGVDPPGGATECGIVKGGVAMCNCKGSPELHGFVIGDASKKAPPEEWAALVCALYYEQPEADYVDGEDNFGGDMVKATIRGADLNVRYRSVHATRGKQVRAQPVSAMYDRGRVHHVGIFPKLEEEMTSWVPGMPSPNHLDALVWVFTKLLVGSAGILGVVEHVKAEDVKRQDEIAKVTQSAMTKPVTSDATPGCPQCNAKCIANVGRQKRCGQCGHQWTPEGAAGPAAAKPMNRTAMLEKMETR